ncbi:site-2 protease family protein [Longispora urticae]
MNYQLGARREHFRPSPVFVALLAVTLAGGAMAYLGYGSVKFDVFLLVIGGWLVSLCLHEFAHAFTAYRGGDHSVAARGYLTLNPLKYTHVLLSIVLPLLFVLLGGIGLPGGAVWIDRGAVRGRFRRSLISAVGPAVNIVFGLALAAPFWFDPYPAEHRAFWAGLAFLGFLQFTAGLLNLLPIPGLDGYGIIQEYLPHDWRSALDKAQPWGMLFVFALLWWPPGGAVFFRIVYFLCELVGLPRDFVGAGSALIRFWQ